MTNATAVTFRPATAQDAAAAIPLILSSGPDTFAYVFQTARRSPAGFLHQAFGDGAGQFGFRNHVVGAVDGRVVAAGAGWASNSTLPFMLADFHMAFTLAVSVVVVELFIISWIRHHYMDTPFLSAAFQVVVGGLLVFFAGMLIGSS